MLFRSDYEYTCDGDKDGNEFLVEHDALIGMHLRRVAVPVRLSLSKIGEANILCARTRPKLIGGERAKYTEED